MVVVQSVQNRVFELMVSHLEQVAVELFDAYGIPAEAGAASEVVFEPAGAASNLAVMGFVGEGIRGALIMIALDSAVVAWLKAMGETSGDPADVLGEFANMLLGRLKTRLIPEGLPLQVSTPTTASGNGLRLSTPPASSRWIGVRGKDWDVKVRLDTTFDSHFQLQDVRAAEAPAEAGEAIFF